jgi:hypothetical protein
MELYFTTCNDDGRRTLSKSVIFLGPDWIGFDHIYEKEISP